MSLRTVKRILNRPGGRALLGKLVTWKAHSTGGGGATIFFDDCWVHEFPDGSIAEWEPKTRKNLTRSFSAQRDYWFSFYEPRPGDTVVDAGAGIGCETILFSHAVDASGRVLSIEAHPKTFQCLKKTCYLNRLQNVISINVALLECPRDVFLEDTSHHIANSVTLHGAGSLRVTGRRLDSICEEYGIDRIDYLKMNIEGAERFAVQGIGEMIDRTAHVGIACHDFKADKTGNDFFRTKVEITRFLLENEFEIVEIPFEQPWAQDHVYAYNPRLVDYQR